MLSNYIKVFINIRNIFLPNETRLLGRWNLKHDLDKCESYILNQYADPGYFKSNKK